MFPEIDYDKIDTPRGMDITIVTTATDDAAGKALLDAFGFPFRQANDPNAPPPRSVAAWPGPRQEEVVRDGQESTDQQGRGEPQVQGPRVHPLPPLRPARSVFRKFGLCRVCLRELAHAGEIPGLTKSSW